MISILWGYNNGNTYIHIYISIYLSISAMKVSLFRDPPVKVNVNIYMYIQQQVIFCWFDIFCGDFCFTFIAVLTIKHMLMESRSDSWSMMNEGVILPFFCWKICINQPL